jgi:hypothetical protein
MKKIKNLTLICVLLAPYGISLASQEGDIRAAILAADAAVEQAEAQVNKSAMEKLYSEKFLHIHVGGALIDTKESELKSPVPIGFYLSKEKENVDLRIFGDTALLSYFLTVRHNIALFPGMTPITRYHQLRVYTIENKVWRLVHQQTTWAVDTQEHSNEVNKYIYSKGYFFPPGARNLSLYPSEISNKKTVKNTNKE